jgi:hypothetical protein
MQQLLQQQQQPALLQAEQQCWMSVGPATTLPMACIGGAAVAAAASRPWHAVGVQQQDAPRLQQQQQLTWVPFSWTAAAKSSPSNSVVKSRILSALGWGLVQPVASTDSSGSSSSSSVLWGSRFLSTSSDSSDENSSLVVRSFDTPWWQGGDAAAAQTAAMQSQNRPRVSIADLQLPPDGSSSSSTTTTAAVGSSNASTGTAPAAAAQPGGRRHLAQAGSSSSSSSGGGSTELPVQAQAQQEQRQALFNSGALCSATINYGASVGDASKRNTADVPIFVGVFDVAVTAQQQVGRLCSLRVLSTKLAGQCSSGANASLVVHLTCVRIKLSMCVLAFLHAALQCMHCQS